MGYWCMTAYSLKPLLQVVRAIAGVPTIMVLDGAFGAMQIVLFTIMGGGKASGLSF